MIGEVEVKELVSLPWNPPYTAHFVEYNRGKREYLGGVTERQIEAIPPVGQMIKMGKYLFLVEFAYIDFETGVVTVSLRKETGIAPYAAPL